jgi:hypothetical protein
MANPQTLRDKIDKMSPHELLSAWRFAPSDSVLLQGEIGKHFSKRFFEMRDELSPEDWTALSKQVGWKR